MKRRDFIKQTSAASAGLIAGGSALGVVACNSNSNKIKKIGTNNKIIKLGIIGTGDRGTGLIHYINDIENLSVTACCDVLDFQLEKSRKFLNNNAVEYTDYRGLLDDKNIDAVLVTTPFYNHSQISIDALDAGKHVYCEKTMAKGYEGIKKLVNKVNVSNDYIFQTGHQYHNSRLYKKVIELVNKGEIGTITAIECQWNRNGNWRRHVPNPSLEKAINWRMYKDYSGGLVAELCSHQIDFSNWLLKETPNKVIGTGGIDYWKDGRETYDNIHLIYSYPSGVKAKFTSITSNSFKNYQIKVLGDKGTIIITEKDAWIYYENSTNKTEKILRIIDGVSGATSTGIKQKGKSLNESHLNPSKQALIDFRDNILNNTIPSSNVNTGANTAICVQMGLDAMDNDSSVLWKNII